MGINKVVYSHFIIYNRNRYKERRCHMLKINEIFGPTIQGEGKSSGASVVFIRLAYCNLHCIWCDTPYTWNWEGSSFKHKEKFSKEKEVHKIEIEEILKQVSDRNSIKTITNIVISGGEPLLQQKDLIPLVRQLSKKYFIEIETNGTIPILDELDIYIDQYNVSPKLSNSENEGVLIEVEVALRLFSNNSKSTFKFVIQTEKDVDEVIFLVKKYNMKNIYLMPEGITRNQLLMKEKLVKQLAKENNFFFTQRLHIINLGGGRGI